MTIRNLLLATAALGLALVGAAPAASAFAETCVVSSYFSVTHVDCSGAVSRSTTVDWCPNEPWIDCYEGHVATCEVGTRLPWECRSPPLTPFLP